MEGEVEPNHCFACKSFLLHGERQALGLVTVRAADRKPQVRDRKSFPESWVSSRLIQPLWGKGVLADVKLMG